MAIGLPRFTELSYPMGQGALLYHQTGSETSVNGGIEIETTHILA